MQFSWTTFTIEIINFIILIWILKRLLYIPIKKIINQRQENIQRTLDQAKQLKIEAKLVEEQYKDRLQSWEQEKDKSKRELHQEMVELKQKELKNLQESIDKEKEIFEAKLQHQSQKQQQYVIKQSLLVAMEFASKFLGNCSDEHLEKKIIDQFLKQLEHLPTGKYRNIISELKSTKTIKFETAYPLSKELKQRITKQIQDTFKCTITLNEGQNSNLLAGASVEIGSINLQANLRDELKFFAEVASESTQT